MTSSPLRPPYVATDIVDSRHKAFGTSRVPMAFRNCLANGVGQLALADREIRNCQAKKRTHHKIALHWTALTRLEPLETVRLMSFRSPYSPLLDRQLEGFKIHQALSLSSGVASGVGRPALADREFKNCQAKQNNTPKNSRTLDSPHATRALRNRRANVAFVPCASIVRRCQQCRTAGASRS